MLGLPAEDVDRAYAVIWNVPLQVVQRYRVVVPPPCKRVFLKMSVA